MEDRKMQFLCFVIGCSILAVTSKTIDNVEIIIKRSDQVALPGATLTVTCRLKGFPDPPPLFSIKKGAFMEIIHKPVTEEISNQAYLTTLYKNLGRFNITKTTEGTDIIFTLTITGATLEDTGYYACWAQHETIGPIYEVAVIEIYRPPTEIYTNQNDTTLYLREGEIIPFECVVPAVIPIPSMSLWILDDDRLTPTPLGRTDVRPSNGILDRIRNKTFDAARDVSFDFLVQTQANPRCTENPSIKTCPLHLDYDISAVRSNLRATPFHDGRLLTCAAVMRDFWMDMVNASVVLDVTFAPKIACEGVLANVIRVRVNQTGFKISCRVHSNPPIPDPSVMTDTTSWMDGACNSNNKIVEGSDYAITEEGISSNKKNRTIGLQFKKMIDKSYIGKTYCLRMRNQNGHGEQTITLQDMRIGAAHMTKSATVTYFLSFLLAAMTLYTRN
jgi:hypothetical protein